LNSRKRKETGQKATKKAKIAYLEGRLWLVHPKISFASFANFCSNSSLLTSPEVCSSLVQTFAVLAETGPSLALGFVDIAPLALNSKDEATNGQTPCGYTEL